MENTKQTYTLITGGSEGLGKAMALECAGRGMNLILVALPSIELYQVASFIRHKYNVLVCEFELDLTDEKDRLYLWRRIVENNFSITMLINNAGGGVTSTFTEKSFETWQKLIQLNIMSVVHLTHLLMPELKKHARSYLLNVSSLAIFFYPSQKQVYGATKSFIYFFSRSLCRELKREGVSVSILCPGGIKTTPELFFLHQHGDRWTRSSSMTPERVATIAIRDLLKSKEIIIPGGCNRLFMYLNRVLPDVIKNRMIEKRMRKLSAMNTEAITAHNRTFSGNAA